MGERKGGGERRRREEVTERGRRVEVFASDQLNLQEFKRIGKHVFQASTMQVITWSQGILKQLSYILYYIGLNLTHNRYWYTTTSA